MTLILTTNGVTVNDRLDIASNVERRMAGFACRLVEIFIGEFPIACSAIDKKQCDPGFGNQGAVCPA